MMRNLPILDQNLCLSAGAGAGKTRRLVETYLGLLAGGRGRKPLSPDEVVAITFTDKAAGEMRARVVSSVAEHLSDPALSPEKAARWQKILSRLEWAPISTIHSFCTVLLREFGARIGLDPDFTVLDADQFDNLLAASMDEAIRKGLSKNLPELAHCLADYSLDRLKEILINYYHAFSTMGTLPGDAAELCKREHEKAGKDALNNRLKVRELSRDLAGLRNGELADSKAKFISKLDAFLYDFNELEPCLADEAGQLETLSRLSKNLSGNWGKLAGPVKKELLEVIKSLSLAAALPASAELSRSLLVLLDMLNRAVERELAADSCISFDGLLLKARELLIKDDSVLTELRLRIKALLVDEFQDVNPVQADLVNLICGMDESYAEPEDCLPLLMVVGDRKQSIYGFRGADVSQFNRTMEAFQRGSGILEALPNNYRSHPELVDFFNRLFSEVFSRARHREANPGVYLTFQEHDAQKPGRGDIFDNEHRVTVLSITGAEEYNAAARRELEAKAVAEHLARLIHDQGVAPQKIAILMRRLTQAAVYENALKKAGVDYYTIGGRGFYECLEIVDIISALKATLDPGDDHALAGLLRSPMVGLSDDSLLLIALGNGNKPISLNQAISGKRPIGLGAPPEEEEKWAKARANLKRLRRLVRRLNADEVLTEIYQSFDCRALALGQYGGDQKAANLEKLLEMTGQGLSGADQGVERLANRLEEMYTQTSQEAQAALMGEDADVVRIMTIHKAKGLEFDTVVLPDLAATDPPDKIPPTGPGGLISLPAIDPLTGKRNKSSIYKQLLEISGAAREAESARLFYVACTRAREKLIFSLTDAKRQGAWAKWARELVLEDPAVELRDIPFSRSDKGAGLAPLNSGEQTDARALESQANQIFKRCLNPQPLKASLIRESVSGLEDWFTCPRLYRLTRRFGLDTASLPASGEGTGGLVAARAAELGSLVHRVLEETDLGAGSDGIEDWVRNTDYLTENEILPKALSLARKAWQTELGAIFDESRPDQLFREQPFLLNIPGQAGNPAVEISGEFDLMVIRPGRSLIADYKVTRSIKPPKYRTQLMLYALALAKVLGEDRSKPPPVECWLVFLSDSGGQVEKFHFTWDELAVLEDSIRDFAAKVTRLDRPDALEAYLPNKECPLECPLHGLPGLCAKGAVDS